MSAARGRAPERAGGGTPDAVRSAHGPEAGGAVPLAESKPLPRDIHQAGRNVVYPGTDDPRAMAAAVAAVIHDGADVAAALAAMDAERGKDARLLP